MGNTLDLKKSVYETLRNDTNTVYDYTRVPKKPSYPYITYNFSNSIEAIKDKIDAVDILLEIDFFDYRLDKNTATLDALFDSVDLFINRKDVFETGFCYRLIRQNKLWQLPTIDEHTFRRQLVYTLKYERRD